METSDSIAKALPHQPTPGTPSEKVDEAPDRKSVDRTFSSLYKSGAASVILD